MSAPSSPPLSETLDLPAPARPRGPLRSPAVIFGLSVIAFLALASIFAPWLWTVDPSHLVPSQRLRPPSAAHWLGTDAFGRDVYSRVVYGGRISLAIGAIVAAIAVAIGTMIGLLAGYFRGFDQLVMRVMDGIMVIPGILLAIALVALTGATFATVVVAIAIPEIPRVVRLVRGLVLSLREEAYVEAAIAVGTPVTVLLWRHILPNAMGPLIVQATYIAASAVLIEAGLSFLGAGIPTDIPTWGNIIAEGRSVFRLAPWMIAAPGLCLSLVVLAINLLGDSLRDLLDPRTATSMRDPRA